MAPKKPKQQTPTQANIHTNGSASATRTVDELSLQSFNAKPTLELKAGLFEEVITKFPNDKNRQIELLDTFTTLEKKLAFVKHINSQYQEYTYALIAENLPKDQTIDISNGSYSFYVNFIASLDQAIENTDKQNIRRQVLEKFNLDSLIMLIHPQLGGPLINIYVASLVTEIGFKKAIETGQDDKIQEIIPHFDKVFAAQNVQNNLLNWGKAIFNLSASAYNKVTGQQAAPEIKFTKQTRDCMNRAIVAVLTTDTTKANSSIITKYLDNQDNFTSFLDYIVTIGNLNQIVSLIERRLTTQATADVKLNNISAKLSEEHLAGFIKTSQIASKLINAAVIDQGQAKIKVTSIIKGMLSSKEAVSTDVAAINNFLRQTNFFANSTITAEELVQILSHGVTKGYFSGTSIDYNALTQIGAKLSAEQLSSLLKDDNYRALFVKYHKQIDQVKFSEAIWNYVKSGAKLEETVVDYMFANGFFKYALENHQNEFAATIQPILAKLPNGKEHTEANSRKARLIINIASTLKDKNDAEIADFIFNTFNGLLNEDVLAERRFQVFEVNQAEENTTSLKPEILKLLRQKASLPDTARTEGPVITVVPPVSPVASTTTTAPTTAPVASTTTTAPTTAPVISTTTTVPTPAPVASTTTTVPTPAPVTSTTTTVPTTTPVATTTTTVPTTAPVISTTTTVPATAPVISTTTTAPTTAPVATTTTTAAPTPAAGDATIDPKLVLKKIAKTYFKTPSRLDEVFEKSLKEVLSTTKVASSETESIANELVVELKNDKRVVSNFTLTEKREWPQFWKDLGSTIYYMLFWIFNAKDPGKLWGEGRITLAPELNQNALNNFVDDIVKKHQPQQTGKQL